MLHVLHQLIEKQKCQCDVCQELNRVSVRDVRPGDDDVETDGM